MTPARKEKDQFFFIFLIVGNKNDDFTIYYKLFSNKIKFWMKNMIYILNRWKKTFGPNLNLKKKKKKVL